MACEIQRFFLLSNFSTSNAKALKIESFYTKISLEKSLKFENFAGEFYRIKSFKNQISKKEKISKKIYKKAQKKLIGQRLVKTRYELECHPFKAFVDIYKKPEICILKVIFPSFKLNDSFDYFKEFDIKKELFNINSKNLILYGFENEKINTQKCFKIIEKSPNLSLEFPNYIKAFDGFLVLFFYLFNKLKIYHKEFLEKNKQKNFYNFSLYAEKILIFLSIADKILDKNLSEILRLRFEKLVFISKEILNKDLNKQLAFLNNEKTINLLSDFEFFIRENCFYKSEEKDILFKILLAYELRKKIIFLRKKINYDIIAFEKILFEVSIFLEYFHNFFEPKSLKKLYFKYICSKNKMIKIIRNKDKFCNLLEKISKNLKIYKG